jgi:5-methylcytosine-specific restriction endonuclease McrA
MTDEQKELRRSQARAQQAKRLADPIYRADYNKRVREKLQRDHARRKYKNLAQRERDSAKKSRGETRRHVQTEYREVILNLLAERDGWRCWICSADLSVKTGSPDHIISPLEGGTHTLANLKMACRSCNISRGSKVRWRKKGTT